jgi:addiction module RelE/StbE family toxin
MAQIRWTEQALDDLDAACDYIARDAPRAADELAARVTRSVARLSDFPRSGRIVPELERERDDIREIIVGRYRIMYRLRTDLDAVEVVAVHHGAQLLRDLSDL